MVRQTYKLSKEGFLRKDEEKKDIVIMSKFLTEKVIHHGKRGEGKEKWDEKLSKFYREVVF